MLFGYRTDTGITSIEHILPILKFYFLVGVVQKMHGDHPIL